jgi:hypothetical protein
VKHRGLLSVSSVVALLRKQAVDQA